MLYVVQYFSHAIGSSISKHLMMQILRVEILFQVAERVSGDKRLFCIMELHSELIDKEPLPV